MSDFDYDLIVMGAGSGGTRTARISASYGAKTLGKSPKCFPKWCCLSTLSAPPSCSARCSRRWSSSNSGSHVTPMTVLRGPVTARAAGLPNGVEGLRDLPHLATGQADQKT